MDAQSRVVSTLPSGSINLPAFHTFDYGQAPPSISHGYLLRVLGCFGFPEPLLCFLMAIYDGIVCFDAAGHEKRVLHPIASG
eukprot:4022648-Pyramimonas_sp.AAC.1